ncbi:MAG: SH3 domain-containing protein [bacterium]|nr:SH3 domain-containing protein [bacterium]
MNIKMIIKTIVVILFIVLMQQFVTAGKGPEVYYKKGQALYVYALTGLNLRKKPESSGKKIATIPYGKKVRVLTLTKKILTAGNIKGYWIEVSYKGKKGYIFDGFLSSLPAPKLNDAATVKKYAKKHGVAISEESAEIFSEQVLKVKNIRLSEGFLIGRALAVSTDWWFSNRDRFPIKSKTYKETYKTKDGQTFKLDVEITVHQKDGKISGINILKDAGGYRRILSLEKKKDGVHITFSVVD